MTHFVSSILHIIGAAAVLLAAPRFMIRVGTTRLLRLGSVIHVFAVAFLLSFSALYHFSRFALGPDTPATQGFRQLDHIGIWLVIGGFFTLPHLIGFRGAWRWVPLVVVWTAAAAGLVFKIFWFGQLSLTANFLLYAATSAVGVASLLRFATLHGLHFVRWVAGCYGSYIAGAFFLLFKPPDLIEGVVGSHEVWHVGVLVGTWCHWNFVLRLAERCAVTRSEDRPAPANSPLEHQHQTGTR